MNLNLSETAGFAPEPTMWAIEGSIFGAPDFYKNEALPRSELR